MAMDFKAGTRIGNYILDSFIGGGGFGVVWLAHAVDGSRVVAVKLLNGGLAEGTISAHRADIEVLAAAAAARSEHVVKVLGGGVDPLPYIVMEYIEGSDLSSLLAAQGRLDYQQTIDVGIGISDALRALSEAGIIHRDIKPANVMIDSNNVVKLADFGIAKIMGYETLTMTGQTAMTMAYAAPEVWDDSGRFGRPTTKLDLYALGVVLFQCVAGALPFVGNFGSLYRQHTEQPPDLSVLPADVPPSLRLVIQRCLEKRQEDRPRDAAECLTMLQRAGAELAQSSKKEPSRFGPWIKDGPHERQVWAWHCHHEVRGDRATVEVHFADNVDYASTLRKAVAVNRALVPLGAERLIETSRLLLHPEEAWYEPPPGRFQFWIAREDLDAAPTTSLTEPSLRTAVTAISAMMEVCRRDAVPLDFGNGNLILRTNGSIYLRRPGLSQPTAEASRTLMAFFAAQSLFPGAKALLDESSSFDALVALVTNPDAADVEATRIMPRRRNDDATVVRDSDATIVGPPRDADATVVRRSQTPPPAVPPVVVPPPSPRPQRQQEVRETPTAPSQEPVIARRIVSPPPQASPPVVPQPVSSSRAAPAAAPPVRPPQPPRTPPPRRRGPPWWLILGGGAAGIGGVAAAAFLALGGNVHKLPSFSFAQGTPSVVSGTPTVVGLTPVPAASPAAGGARTGAGRRTQLVDALLFVSDRDGHEEIYVMNADGSDQRRLTNTAKANNLPDAFLNGDRVVFTSARDPEGGSELYDMRVDGSLQTHIPTVPGLKLEPNITSDGKHIVFEVMRGENYDVYTADIDGKNAVDLTNSPSADIDPVWSPDGKRIVFGSNREGNMDIWVMNANGTDAHRLTNSPGFNGEPDWSPDGKRIVFESDRRGNFDLYVMNDDGSNVARLGDDPGDEYDPAWSPDGKVIAYTSHKGPTNEVFLINADGSGTPRDLSNNPANDGKPAWVKLRRVQ